MRITIIAMGSRGDVQPYLALGRGLMEAGHYVRLVSHVDFEDLIGAYGLEFWPVDVKVQEIAQSAEMRERLESGNFVAVLAEMAKGAKGGIVKLAQTSLSASQAADLLLAGIGGLFTGQAIAEKLRIPLVQAYYIPFTPTGAYPSFLLPSLPDVAGTAFGGLVNRLSYTVARQMMWQPYRAADRAARREVLELPPAPFSGWPTIKEGDLVLYGYSPAVIPPPPDWGSNVHVTGYWFLDPLEAWSPPAELTAFLDAGPPPIYVGFGSMSSRSPQATLDLVLRALDQAQQRAILLSGWDGLTATDLPDSVMMIESAPFGWLFPQMAAVVHHGGAGTTSAGLRAGVPSVVIPFFGDQPFWGQRVADLGVGPVPIPRRRLTADQLAEAIDRVVTDASMQRRAADLGTRIRAEGGVATAVDLIERWWAGRSS